MNSQKDFGNPDAYVSERRRRLLEALHAANVPTGTHLPPTPQPAPEYIPPNPMDPMDPKTMALIRIKFEPRR